MLDRQNNRVTIYDIATELGISTGTVNRALNNKPRISAETKRRVIDAAERMGYKANSIAQGLRRKPINIGVVLSCPVEMCTNEIRRGMESAFSELQEYNVFRHYTLIGNIPVPEYEKKAQDALEYYRNQKYNGIIVFLSGNNTVFRGQLNEIAGDGIVIATVGNDVADCGKKISVSADGRCAGMLSAEMLYLCCAVKKAAILTGSMNIRIHRDNIDGFYSFAETHPFGYVRLYEHWDNTAMVARVTEQMLTESPDIDGIYITSALAPLVCGKICEMGYREKVKIIATDLFGKTSELLAGGIISAVIFQNQFQQGYDVVKYVFDHICGKSENKVEKHLITPQLILTSNMKNYL